MKKNGFTLAEVLTTLTIIGVIAALSVPALVSNFENHEYTSSLKKAMNSLNNALSANLASTGQSPLEIENGSNIASYLMRHMTVIKTTDFNQANKNSVLYTADGMRIEIPKDTALTQPAGLRLHETNNTVGSTNTKCGTYGLIERTRTRASKVHPCVIMIDVNGDKLPNAHPSAGNPMASNPYKWAELNDEDLSDVFVFLITDKRAIPFGVVAQKALYGEDYTSRQQQ